MKKLLLALFVLMLTAGVVAAQDAISQAEADYLFQFDQYRSAYQLYQVDKAEYLDSGTLVSEKEALDSAKNASIARAEVLRTYTQWLRLQLLTYETIYPRSAELAARLAELNQWYEQHQQQIEAVNTTDSFESVQAEYLSARESREKLYLQAQIELKLSKLTTFRQELIRLYDELKIKLENQPSSFEIEQGIIRADAKIIELEDDIQELSEFASQLELVPQPGRRVSNRDNIRREATTRLESMRQDILQTITLLSELEARYE